MEKIELVKGLTYLGIATGKEYTEQECEIFYDFLKNYDYQTFIKAIKNRILKSSFAPKINELIEECNLCKQEIEAKTIEYMNSKGYFKTIEEYEKALFFLKSGVIPKWLKDDMYNYYPKINNRIEERSKILLESAK